MKLNLLNLISGVIYDSGRCLSAIKRLLPYLSPEHLAELRTAVDALIPAAAPEVAAVEVAVDAAVAVANTVVNEISTAPAPGAVAINTPSS